MTEWSWAMLLEILTQVEDELPSNAGVISYAGGGVFVEDGRVCWAAAKGMANRLTDLLAQKARPGVDLAAVYRQCRDAHRPLGEALVESGAVSVDDLAMSLRRHTAESLIEIVNVASTGTWTARDGGYAPQFTFTPLETYFDVVEIVLGGLHRMGATELSVLARPERRGAAFAPLGDVIVPIACSGEVVLRDLWILGAWASSLRDAAHELAVDPGFALGTTDAGQTTVVWWRDDLTFALIGEDRAAVTEMISFHLRRGRA